jgi:hypothetical protein
MWRIMNGVMRDKHSPEKILVTITLIVLLLLGLAISALAWRMHNDRYSYLQTTARQ